MTSKACVLVEGREAPKAFATSDEREGGERGEVGRGGNPRLRAKGQIAREGRCVGVSSECAPIPVGHLQFCAARHWSRGKHCNRNYPTVFKQAQPWVGARGHQAAMQWKVVLFLPSLPRSPSSLLMHGWGLSQGGSMLLVRIFGLDGRGGGWRAHT